MSTTKRPRTKKPEVSPLPASKRQKTDGATKKGGLEFLADEEARKGKKIEARLTNGVPSAKSTRLDESRANIETDIQEDTTTNKLPQKEVIDISSGEEEESDLEDSDVEEPETIEKPQDQLALTNGHTEDDAPSPENDEDLGEPSFGDLLQARHPQAIDVHASFADPSTLRSTLIPTGDRHPAPLATTSLTTVLTQALKTNDKDLLEKCFHVSDLASIRATIQRLSSQHVSILLQKLAERIHKAPGRAGILMSWIQWSLVAHGGFLASQPDLMRKLKSLTQIMRERASGLEPLLHLKGKLDMLSAQLELRRSMLVASRTVDEGSDEDAVLYVEDEDDGQVSDDDESSVVVQKKRILAGARSKVKDSQDSDAESGSEDDLPNGVDHESAGESGESEDDDAEGLIDIEAEETSDDEDDELEEDEEGDSESGDEDEEADEDLSDEDEDMEDEIVVRPPQPKTLNRKR